MKKLIAVIVVSMSFGAVMGAVGSSAFAEPQPAMRRALNQLQAARASLEAATPDKGGHRAKALVHVQKAIEETKRGIAADNQN